MKEPDILLDDEGYPTNEYIDFIYNYNPYEGMSTITFIKTILINGWWMPEFGFKLHKKYKGKYKLELHTGGWSGNEEIISAIKDNIYLTNFNMKYIMWKAGGHYYFEISDRVLTKN